MRPTGSVVAGTPVDTKARVTWPFSADVWLSYLKPVCTRGCVDRQHQQSLRSGKCEGPLGSNLDEMLPLHEPPHHPT